jgi:uncharacterized membrane protein YbhN (UPF0104 family)
VNKRIVFTLLQYLLAFGLLGWVVYSNWAPPTGVGLKDIWQKHVVQGQPIHAQFLLIGALVYTISILLTLMRWYLLVRAQDLPFKVSDALRLGMVGFFYNTFLPGSVGGDAVRAAVLAREQSRRTVAVATVIMDRVIALWGLIWFVALLGSAFWAAGMLNGPGEGAAKMIVKTAGVIVGVTAAIWVGLGFLPQRRADIFAGRLARVPKIGGNLAELWRATWLYRLRPKSIALTLALSWVGHVGFVLAFYCFARTLWDKTNPIPTLTEHFLLVPIGLVIQAAPLFPGGAGIGEMGFGGLYVLLAGKSAEASGVAASMVQRVCCWVLGLVGFVIYQRMRSGQPAATPVTTPASVGAIEAREPLWGAAVPVESVQVSRD